jgi:1-phosphofructokinase
MTTLSETVRLAAAPSTKAEPIGPAAGTAADRVVTVTANPAIDHTVWIPGFRAGEVNRVAAEDRSPGGKGVNVAAALRALGVGRVEVTGFLGAENCGLFEAFFAAEGIGDRFLRVPGATRTGIKIVDDSTGDTTDVNFPGPALGPDDVDELAAVVAEAAEGAAWVVLSGSLPPGAPVDLYARLTAAAHAGGAAVALDTSGPALAAAVPAGPDLVKPNAEELVELAGRPLPSRTARLAAADDLRAAGVDTVVVSLGGEGALFVAGEGAVVARPPPVAVRSTVGAGDAMVAGTIAALLRGEPLTGVARLATACGAAAVAGVGPRLDPAEVARRAGEVAVETLTGPRPARLPHPRLRGIS